MIICILEKFLKFVVGFSAVLFLIACVGSCFFTVNYTTSFPPGLYLNISKIPEKGDLVRFCPQPSSVFEMAKERGYIASGYCLGDYGFLIKKILAAKGDIVEFTLEGVFVNGTLVENTAPKVEDSKGNGMPIFLGKYTLQGEEVLLLSDYNPWSFDARYFGLQPFKQVETVIVPLKIW